MAYGGSYSDESDDDHYYHEDSYSLDRDYNEDDYHDYEVENEDEDEDHDHGYEYDFTHSDEDDDVEPPGRERLQYVPEISPAAIQTIIREEMAKQNVQEQEIPIESSREFDIKNDYSKSKRYFEVKGFAWFTCLNGHQKKQWPSAHAWCFIDLKKQEICYRYEQECKKCNAKKEPEFTEEAIKKMAVYVVKKFLIRMNRIEPVHKPSTDTDQTEGGPHDEKRCGKCIRLGRSCWKKQ